MPNFTNAFDSYQVFFYGADGAGSPPNKYAAVIQCYQADSFVGRIAFFFTTVPPNTTINPMGTEIPSIHYNIDKFFAIFSLLRHTQPLYLFLTGGVGGVATAGNIPVGEEEGK